MDYHFILQVFDNHAHLHKDHQVKSTLEINQRYNLPLADNYDQICYQFRADTVTAGFQRRPYNGRKADGNPKPAKPYAARANGSQSAGFIIGALPQDTVFFFYGHGTEGSGSISTSTKMIYAKRCSPNCQHGEVFLEDGDMKNCLLVVFGTCHSAETNPEHGNIAEQTHRQGAQASVGFYGYGPGYAQDKAWSPHKIWAFFLWEALCRGKRDESGAVTCDPVGITEALKYARDRTHQRFGNFWWTDNFRVYPSGSQQKIKLLAW